MVVNVHDTDEKVNVMTMRKIASMASGAHLYIRIEKARWCWT